MSINSASLRLSAIRALLFNIPLNVRFISIELVEQECVNLVVYFEQNPSASDVESIYSACGEICGDFIELNEIAPKLNVSSKPYDKLDHCQYTIFARIDGYQDLSNGLRDIT